MDTELLNQVMHTLNEHGAYAVKEYTVYHAAEAKGWLYAGISMSLVGIVSLIGAVLDDEFGRPLWAILGSIVLCVGICTTADQIGTLANPEAMAIHQLINDVRG